jgi:hypothetical protein
MNRSIIEGFAVAGCPAFAGHGSRWIRASAAERALAIGPLLRPIVDL